MWKQEICGRLTKLRGHPPDQALYLAFMLLSPPLRSAGLSTSCMMPCMVLAEVLHLE